MIKVKSFDEVVPTYSPEGLRISIGDFMGLMHWYEGVDEAISTYKMYESLYDIGAITVEFVNFDIRPEMVRMPREVARDFVFELRWYLALYHRLSGEPIGEKDPFGLYKIPVSTLSILSLVSRFGELPRDAEIGRIGAHEYEYGICEIRPPSGGVIRAPEKIEVVDYEEVPTKCFLCGAEIDAGYSTVYDPKEVSGYARCPVCLMGFYYRVYPKKEVKK